jgi:hypothetical protein
LSWPLPVRGTDRKKRETRYSIVFFFIFICIYLP